MAAPRTAALALRRLASVAAAASSQRSALLVAPLRAQAWAVAAPTTRGNLPQSASAAALYARRGYATRGGGAGRKSKAVSESEEEDDDDEFEAMDSDEEFDRDFDDDDGEEFDDGEDF